MAGMGLLGSSQLTLHCLLKLFNRPSPTPFLEGSMEEHGSTSPFHLRRTNRPIFPSPSSVNNYTTTGSPSRSLVPTAHEYQSPTSTPTNQALKSPASDTNTLMTMTGSPTIHTSTWKTPSPSSGQIRPWLLADCVESPIKNASPAIKTLKFKSPMSGKGDCTKNPGKDGGLYMQSPKLKSPKAEPGDSSARALREEINILLGRPINKRAGSPLAHPNSSFPSKCLKLSIASGDVCPKPASVPKLIEVVEISDDDDHVPKSQGIPISGGERKVEDAHTVDVMRAAAMLENAAKSLITDLESIVRAVGHMMESTITICNYYTRGA